MNLAKKCLLSATGGTLLAIGLNLFNSDSNKTPVTYLGFTPYEQSVQRALPEDLRRPLPISDSVTVNGITSARAINILSIGGKPTSITEALAVYSELNPATILIPELDQTGQLGTYVTVDRNNLASYLASLPQSITP